MGPEKPLPYGDAFISPEAYVDSLLDFVGSNELLRTLCGGVHVLDFFTTNPPLYDRLLPQDWRDFFREHEIMDILDLLIREDLSQFQVGSGSQKQWRDGRSPPLSLIEYIETVRKHLLLREPAGSQCARNRAMKPTQKLARHVAVGMNIKKVHEVGLFAHYINNLTESVSSSSGNEISHLVDFGSGQNYLGRVLASEPYNESIVAIESKSHNAERAKEFDVMAKLATKKTIMRNKKAFRAGLEGSGLSTNLPTPPPEPASSETEELEPQPALDGTLDPAIEMSSEAKGKIQYIDHRILDGDLTSVITRMSSPSPSASLMVMSLHSCGNLVHHGLRSLLLNPSVRAVAMVGCCYNLLTERLGPATYKHPDLLGSSREHPRLEKTGAACDPHGFPMSDRLCNNDKIRLNITARMMAVQAPSNWGPQDSEAFFKRHFFRALLQRIFLDRGVVGPPSTDYEGGSPAGHSSGTPIIIGHLRKSCYGSFVDYVRGALEKLYLDPENGELFRQKMAGLTEEEIEGYEERFRERKKDLSVVWSLMAFSAGVIEAAIVVDRWLWLQEQAEVKEAWVEAVFDYRLSPRNLVVVGAKRP